MAEGVEGCGRAPPHGLRREVGEEPSARATQPKPVQLRWQLSALSATEHSALRTLAAGGGASPFLALPGVSALAMPLRRWKMMSSRYLQEERRNRK